MLIDGEAAPVNIRLDGDEPGAPRGKLEMSVDGRLFRPVCDSGDSFERRMFGPHEAAIFCAALGYEGSNAQAYRTEKDAWRYAAAGITCDGATSLSGCSDGHGGDGALLSSSDSSECPVTDDGRCVTSRNYPDEYGNGEDCSIYVTGAGTVSSVDTFSTESSYDYLTIADERYEGSSGPSGVEVNEETEISWRTDGSVTRSGFKLCVDGSLLGDVYVPRRHLCLRTCSGSSSLALCFSGNCEDDDAVGLDCGDGALAGFDSCRDCGEAMTLDEECSFSGHTCDFRTCEP